LQLCHRLDKETSGVMVLSKNEEAYKKMARKFEAREVKKIYHAVVAGNYEVKEKVISIPITITNKGIAKIDKREGKQAETIFTTRKKFRHFSLIECLPVTGRLHQIRIHLASQNFPIVADELYGGKIPMLYEFKKKFKPTDDSGQNGMIKRVALHAFSIEFELFEKKYGVEAPYPKDLKVFLKLLEKYDN
ncbi:MAG: RluA family pseudouridine synthase, partial [Bacteroidia bacterium]